MVKTPRIKEEGKGKEKVSGIESESYDLERSLLGKENETGAGSGNFLRIFKLIRWATLNKPGSGKQPSLNRTGPASRQV
jgi:hypothetical protein